MSRITNSILTNNYLGDLQTNLRQMSTLQNQLSSGSLINRASDNVSAATRIMQLNTELSANTQYKANITDASNWLDTTDTALSEAGNVLSRIRELMVKAGNGTYSEDEISSIKDEVVSAVQQLGQVLNTSYEGNHIFGGTKSTSKTITVDDDGNMSYADADGNAMESTDADYDKYYNQISSDLKTEISDGITVTYNVNAADLLEFKDDSLGNVNAMDVFSDIITNLTTASSSTATEEEKSEAISNLNGDNLTQIDSVIDNFLTARSKVGTMQNRMDSASTTNENQTYNMTSVLSSVQDIDIAEKTVEYSSAQTIYKAALQVSSSVLTKTIMDYI